MKAPVPEFLFVIKLQAEACNFIKKETVAQVFSCEFYKIFKNTFFTEHLWTAGFASSERLLLNHPVSVSFCYYNVTSA